MCVRVSWCVCVGDCIAWADSELLCMLHLVCRTCCCDWQMVWAYAWPVGRPGPPSPFLFIIIAQRIRDTWLKKNDDCFLTSILLVVALFDVGCSYTVNRTCPSPPMFCRNPHTCAPQCGASCALLNGIPSTARPSSSPWARRGPCPGL